MDSYLEIAERVLSQKRVPLSATEILEIAYIERLVPSHLYGRTQHKTLQARLSEDILLRRNKSDFYRTEPGRFFLRKFLRRKDISNEFKREFIARRRIRDLDAELVLTIPLEFCKKIRGLWLDRKTSLEKIKSSSISYLPYKLAKNDVDKVVLTTFVVVMRGDEILTHRKGRFRSYSDAFSQKRCVGFTFNVTDEDCDLFSSSDLGVINSGIKGLSDDLGLSPELAFEAKEEGLIEYKGLLHITDETFLNNRLAAVVLYSCPNQFEPTKQRLAINDLRWMSVRTKPNNINDFEAWSVYLLENVFFIEKELRKLQMA